MGPNATSPPISATQAFDCSTDELWTLISAPGNLNDAHPFCDRNDALVWDGETHRDRLVYLNGRTYVREFQTWKPGEGYTLLIGEEGGPQSYVIWTIEATKKEARNSPSPFTPTCWPTCRAWWRSCLTGFGLSQECEPTCAASSVALPMSPRPANRCRATVSAGIHGFREGDGAIPDESRRFSVSRVCERGQQ